MTCSNSSGEYSRSNAIGLCPSSRHRCGLTSLKISTTSGCQLHHRVCAISTHFWYEVSPVSTVWFKISFVIKHFLIVFRAYRLARPLSRRALWRTASRLAVKTSMPPSVPLSASEPDLTCRILILEKWIYYMLTIGFQALGFVRYYCMLLCPDGCHEFFYYCHPFSPPLFCFFSV